MMILKRISTEIQTPTGNESGGSLYTKYVWMENSNQPDIYSKKSKA